jgi:hypothetical protein
MHVRVCVDCGEEYRPEIEVCADCGGVLRDADDEAPDAAAGAPAPPSITAQDLEGHRIVFQTREPRDLVPAVEAVREAGIAFQIAESRVQNDERRSALSIVVREDDAPAAMRALAPLLGPEAVAYSEGSEEPTADGDARCPACETVVHAGTRECPECGLGLSGEGEPDEKG